MGEISIYCISWMCVVNICRVVLVGEFRRQITPPLEADTTSRLSDERQVNKTVGGAKSSADV